ncbi:MAG: rRNA maturation RNase YbeY [Acidobacteriota bacterium]
MNRLKRSEPKINVFNRQRKIAVKTKPLKDFLYRLSSQVAPHAAFSVVLISDPLMKSYNQEFRCEDRATDVLSFPYEEDEWEEESYLGDILISVETAHRQRRKTLLEELKVLSLHGLLHLLGYDHETDRGEMEVLERKLKREFRVQ